MHKYKYTTSIIGFFLVFLLFPNRAFAYIDVGLAGQLFQLVYLVFIGILAFVVSPILFFWKRIRARLKFSRKKKNVEVDDKQFNEDA